MIKIDNKLHITAGNFLLFENKYLKSSLKVVAYENLFLANFLHLFISFFFLHYFSSLKCISKLSLNLH